mgnify:CR=1 FL=1
MKNLIIKIAILTAIMFGLSGCGATAINGLSVNNDSVLKDNSKTKVYYEDLSEKFVIEANKKLVEDLNNQEIIPDVWWTITSSNEVKNINEAKFTIKKNVERKKVEGGKFKLLDDNRTIFYDKKYNNLQEAFQDAENIYQLIVKDKLRVTVKDSSFRDKYMTSEIIPSYKEDIVNGLKFETKYSTLQKAISSNVQKQIELGGWQMVNNPEDADKQIYLDISRDYSLVELDYLKKENKNIKFLSLELSDSNFNLYGKNNSSHIGVGQSAMNLASNSNNDLTSAAIGLAVAGVFSLLGNKEPNKEKITGSFVSLRIIDTIKNTDTIKLYDSFIRSNANKRDNEELLEKINQTINIDPNSKKYNIN